MSIAQQTLEEFDDEMARTRKVLAAVTSELMNWQAGDGFHTIGWNANHIADSISWTTFILDVDEFDIAPVDGPAHENPTLEDPAEVLASFDASVEKARAEFAAASDEKLSENWTMKMAGETLFTMTKGDCIRKWVMNHSIHHRGILSVYLRMNGVELTPVYDE